MICKYNLEWTIAKIAVIDHHYTIKERHAVSANGMGSAA